MSLFIGLMSGTSMDAVDAALVAFTGDKAQLLEFHQLPVPKDLRADLILSQKRCSNYSPYTPVSQRHIERVEAQSTDVSAVQLHPLRI